jgi:MinD-like ATPase involved in chromosome partitioning or flagellar assembly
MGDPIRVLLSAPGQAAMNELYRAFLADGSRVAVAALAPTPEILETSLSQQPVEVAVVDAELLAERGEHGLVQFLTSRLGSAVAVVLLPQGMSGLHGRLIGLDRVHEVLVKPAGSAHLIDRCYQLGVSQRASQQAMSPATTYATSSLAQATGAARATALTGTRVFAVGGGKGGPGKTTIAVNLAYRLNQVGVRTLLMGFDVPDASGVQLGLSMSPNALNWFRRPTREGFTASLQNKDGLDVILSPNDKLEASRVGARKPGDDGSIVGLIEAARDHHPPYAAIVMDLPPTESEWSVQPLLRANTVLLVCEPDWASQVNLIASVRLLTGVLDPRYQVPRDAIHAVLNRVEEEDTMTPNRMQAAIREQLDGWAPPFVAVIPADPGVRACQNDFVVPVTRRQEFAQGIDQVVDFFYREALGAPAGRATGGRVKSLFGGIKVRFT